MSRSGHTGVGLLMSPGEESRHSQTEVPTDKGERKHSGLVDPGGLDYTRDEKRGSCSVQGPEYTVRPVTEKWDLFGFLPPAPTPHPLQVETQRGWSDDGPHDSPVPRVPR